MRRWLLWRKMYHDWFHDFWVCFGGGKDPLDFQNWDIGGFWANARFILSNGRKTTFEWPKVVSEVIFPRFWGVVCIEKCFRNFEIVVGSAVSEISRFGPFYVKQKTCHPWKSAKNCWPYLQFPFLIMVRRTYASIILKSTKLPQEDLPGLTQVFVDGWPSCVLMGKPPY